MLQISNTVFITDREIEISAIRSQGAGGQNVNKVASAIHLRFDIPASSLPDRYKDRLLHINDNRITSEGVIVIKAQEHRSQEQNREEALRRLQELIKSAIVIPKRRKPSKATRSSQRKRLDSKTKRGQIKAMRGKITDWAIGLIPILSSCQEGKLQTFSPARIPTQETGFRLRSTTALNQYFFYRICALQQVFY